MKSTRQINLEYQIEQMEEAIRQLKEIKGYYFPFSIQLEMESSIKEWKRQLEMSEK